MIGFLVDDKEQRTIPAVSIRARMIDSSLVADDLKYSGEWAHIANWSEPKIDVRLTKEVNRNWRMFSPFIRVKILVPPT